jgi:hypothetical protein
LIGWCSSARLPGANRAVSAKGCRDGGSFR